MSKTYTTIQGDMWDSIAFSQLGSEAYTDRLMNLNPQVSRVLHLSGRDRAEAARPC